MRSSLRRSGTYGHPWVCPVAESCGASFSSALRYARLGADPFDASARCPQHSFPRSSEIFGPACSILQIEPYAERRSIDFVLGPHSVAFHPVQRSRRDDSDRDTSDVEHFRLEIRVAKGLSEPRHEVNPEVFAGRVVLETGIVTV